MNSKIIEIEDYISNSPEAKAIITDFTRSKFIRKMSCGVGGTSAILGITDQTVIICSPLIGMIQSKEADAKHNQLFIYGNKKRNRTTIDGEVRTSWKNIGDYLHDGKQFILNTTPNQLVMLKDGNPYLFGKLTNIPVFVDECHMAAENSWRPELASFMHILFHEWKVPFTLSTATPCYKDLDLPVNILEQMEFYTFRRKNEPQKPIDIYPFNQYQNQIIEEVAKGNRVVLFTNDKKVMTTIVKLEGISTQFLVGETLDTKIKTIKKFTSEEIALMKSAILKNDVDVTVLSTKYLTGFDINFDSASVFIISNYNPVNTVDNRTANDIAQAYGRVRKTKNRAAVFYSNTAYKLTHNEAYYMNRFKQALIDPKPEYLVDGIVNHTRCLNDYLPQIDEYRTFSSTRSLKESLSELGFSVRIMEYETSTLIGSALPVPKRVSCLLNLELMDLYPHVDKVFSSIQGDLKEYNGYTKTYLALFASAYIIKTLENEHLTTSALRSTQIERLVLVVKTSIDANLRSHGYEAEQSWTRYQAPEKAIITAINAGAVSPNFKSWYNRGSRFIDAVKVIDTLYAIRVIWKDGMSEEDKQRVEIASVVSDTVTQDYVEYLALKSHLSTEEITQRIKLNDDILNRLIPHLAIKEAFVETESLILESLSFSPTARQQKLVKARFLRAKQSLTSFDPLAGKPYNIRSRLSSIHINKKTQIKQHQNYLLGLLSMDIAGHSFGFKSLKKHNREYNFATKCASYLRKYTPYLTTEIDIIAANPQFLDRMIGSQKAFNVYESLMARRSINRPEAKVLFNKTLNNHRLPPPAAVSVYNDAGYTDEEARALADLSCGNIIFYDMTKHEEAAITKYKEQARITKVVRLHDALIGYSHNMTSSLPKEVEGIRFSIKEY